MSQQSSNPRVFSPLRNESGKTTNIAMIACLFIMVFYLQFGRAQFLASFVPLADTLVFLSICMISIFTIGCTIHMIILGEVSYREYRSKVANSAERLASFSGSIAKHLEVREQQCCATGASLGNRTIRALSTSRRVSTALNDRINTVYRLLQQDNKADLEAALELLRAPLETDGDCCQQLILGDPIEPIEQEELGPFMQSLFEDIDFGLQGPRQVKEVPSEIASIEHEEAQVSRPRRPTIH